jgi:hypothetical protein
LSNGARLVCQITTGELAPSMPITTPVR